MSPRSLARAPRAVLLVVVALAITLPACPGQRRGLSREALMRGLVELPRPRAEPVLTLDDVASLRVPAPAPAPAELVVNGARLSSLPPLARARTAVALSGDLKAAAAAWRQLGDDPDGLVHRCLTELAYETPAASVPCARFLDVAPADPRAPAVLAALYRARSDNAAVDDVILRGAPRWIAGCAAKAPPAGCADLSQIAHAAERRAAARAKDAERARAAALASGALTSVRVEGPFVGDPLYAFESAGAGRRLAKGARYVAAERTSWSGVFQPSLRNEGGLYRVTASARGGGFANVIARSRNSLRLFVDGALVLERRPELRDEPDATRARVRLSTGVHHIEALVVSQGGSDGVELSFLRDDGAPALRVTAETAATPAGARALEPHALLPEPPKGDPLARLDALLLRHHLGAVGYGIAAGAHLEHARELLRELGFAPQALVAAAWSLGRAGRTPERLAQADAARLWDRVLTTWPDHPSALESRAKLLREERPQEALAIYRQLREARPSHPAGHAGVSELALAEGLLDEAVEAADALLRLDPPPLDVTAATSAFTRVGRYAEAARLDARAARSDDLLYSSASARRLLDAGERDAALQELARLLDEEPGNRAAELRWDLLELTSPEAALQSLEQHLARFPFDRSAWRRRVQLEAALHGDERGRAVATLALAAVGVDPQLWLARVELGATPPWAARLRAGDEAIEAARQAGEGAFPGHPVVLVVDHEETHLFADLSSLSLRHWIVRLGSKEALDGFGELSLPPDERVVRLRVVKPDGSVRLPEFRDGVDDVSLTGLAVGDMVELLTASFDEAPLLPVFAQGLVAFAKPAPALVRSFELFVPARLLDEGLRLFSRSGAPEPQIVRDEESGRAHVTFRATDVAGVSREPHSPDEVEAAPMVGWTFGGGEDEWRVLRGTALLRDARAGPLLARVAEQIAGSGSPRDRWQRLFRFVVTRVEPAAAPSDAAEVLATGRGRRTALLLSLARAAHLVATPVALHPPVSPPLELASANAWPITGVAVELSQRTSFAFVDDGLAILDELPEGARTSAVLDLDLLPRARALTLDDASFSTLPVRVQLDLDWQQDGFKGFLALTVPAAQADAFRRSLRTANKDELRAAFEQALAAALPGASVSAVSLPNLEAFGRPLGVGVELLVPVSGGGLEPARFDHLFTDGATTSLGLFTPLSSYLRVAARQRPLLLNSAHEVLQVEVTLPPGAAFTEVPERLDEDAGPVRLVQHAEVTDGTLSWNRDITVDTARVPVDEWPRFRAKLSALSRLTDARLTFVLPREVAQKR